MLTKKLHPYYWSIILVKLVRLDLPGAPMNTWQLQTAKACLSEVVKQAIHQGPQNITVRGHSAVVVLSRAAYDQLVKPQQSFLDLMRASPLVGVSLKITRNQSKSRDADL